MGLRKCSSCGLEKQLEEHFYKQAKTRSHRSGGYLNQCKFCILQKNRKAQAKPKNKQKTWENKLQYRYGITKQDYERLLIAQKNAVLFAGQQNLHLKLKNTSTFQ